MTEEAKGYRCVKCENEVEIDPVEEKIICPKCSHRVLLKSRSPNPKKVDAL
jgi:DNA-directed RNA polymerase subunit RPC12/RpoP